MLLRRESRSSSSTPSRSTAGARQSSHQSPTTRSSPSPSRRPGWTEFSDDEDVNYTRWKPFILHEKFCFISGVPCFVKKCLHIVQYLGTSICFFQDNGDDDERAWNIRYIPSRSTELDPVWQKFNTLPNYHQSLLYPLHNRHHHSQISKKNVSHHTPWLSAWKLYVAWKPPL